jgi:hypothetical protein
MNEPVQNDPQQLDPNDRPCKKQRKDPFTTTDDSPIWDNLTGEKLQYNGEKPTGGIHFIVYNHTGQSANLPLPWYADQLGCFHEKELKYIQDQIKKWVSPVMKFRKGDIPGYTTYEDNMEERWLVRLPEPNRKDRHCDMSRDKVEKYIKDWGIQWRMSVGEQWYFYNGKYHLLRECQIDHLNDGLMFCLAAPFQCDDVPKDIILSDIPEIPDELAVEDCEEELLKADLDPTYQPGSDVDNNNDAPGGGTEETKNEPETQQTGSGNNNNGNQPMDVDTQKYNCNTDPCCGEKTVLPPVAPTQLAGMKPYDLAKAPATQYASNLLTPIVTSDQTCTLEQPPCMATAWPCASAWKDRTGRLWYKTAEGVMTPWSCYEKYAYYKTIKNTCR